MNNNIKNIRGREAILEQCPEILSDESRYILGVPDEVWFPENNIQLQEIMRRACRENITVTFCGGKTGITGGSVPENGGMAISFSRMDKILKCEANSDGVLILTCQSGITLESITRFLDDPRLWPEPVEGSHLLSPGRYFYPPDPTEMTAQLGGTVATNASGARSFRFGPTRNHIEELEIILTTGDLIKLKRGNFFKGKWKIPTIKGNTEVMLPSYKWPRVKNACGYYSSPQLDPVDLFIGSEGTLGAICSVGIRLREKPRFLSGLSFFPSRDSAFYFADFLRGEKPVTAIEYFDKSVLLLFNNTEWTKGEEFPCLPSHLNCAVYWEYNESSDNPLEKQLEFWEENLNHCGSSLDDTWSGFDTSELQRLKGFRHSIPELVNSIVSYNRRSCPSVRKISTDSSLPGSHFREWFEMCVKRIEEKDIQYAVFGHLGDFHLHINMLPRNEEELQTALFLYRDFMFEACKDGGSISAEHGIGKLKRGFLTCMYTDNEVEQMRRIKKVFDPGNLLNRGTLIV